VTVSIADTELIWVSLGFSVVKAVDKKMHDTQKIATTINGLEIINILFAIVHLLHRWVVG
jgi:hypothetical protein